MGKFSLFKLPLKSLPAGVHEFDIHVGKQFFVDMENTDIKDANLEVHVVVDHKGDFYDLAMNVTGEITLICDRCLDDLEWPVDADYHIVVKYGPDYNDDSDELLEIPESDNDLNVAYMVYDTVVLSIPIKHVHPMGKCNRAMSALLSKHRSSRTDEDSEIEEELIDEMDSMPESSDDQE